MSIQLKDIYFRYEYPKREEILSNVSMSINNGEVVALMGTSGSGKSTLIKIISSFYRPSEGEAFINNIKVEFDRPYKNLAYVAQTALKMVFPWMSVKRNVMYPSVLRGQLTPERIKYCNNLIKVLNIESRNTMYPIKLSGGEQKRLSLAVALSYEPEIILLDEPFSGIDLRLTHELWEFVHNDFKKRNPTVLLVTHSLEEAAILADRVVFISSKEKNIICCDTRESHAHIEDDIPRKELINDSKLSDYKEYLLEQYTLATNNESLQAS